MKVMCPGKTPNSPATPGAYTSSTWVSSTWRSGVISLSCIAASRSSSRGGETLCVRQHVVDRADHEERLLGDVVVLALDDLLEALDRVGQLDVDAGLAGEGLGDVERL